MEETLYIKISILLTYICLERGISADCDEYTNSYPSIRAGNYLQTRSDCEIDRAQIRVEATVRPLWCDAVINTTISHHIGLGLAVLSPNQVWI